jgi:ABC-type transport system involved in cytochrome c biogenesis permease component
MTFLPIVDRELRVAARRRGTYWLRVAAAVLAIFIGGWVFLASWGDPPSRLGQSLFVAMSVLALLGSLLTGIIVTSDCLSEEKRDGTLGLLFLTDLKSYDVVLGKLAATSLNAFYGLVAILPVMAIPFFLGGVSPAEFTRVALVSLNTLFLSLAAGMLASAMCKDERRAMGATILILLLLVLGPPALMAWFKFKNWIPTDEPAFLDACPAYSASLAFERMHNARADRFWRSLGIVHLLGWIFIFLAGRVVAGAWRDKVATARKVRWRERWKLWCLGNSAQRGDYRRELLDVNPILWLASRDRLKRAFVWAFLAVAGCLWLWGYLENRHDWLDTTNYIFTAITLQTFLKLWVCTEACRRFSEDRNAGALELLLSTPMKVAEILGGQLQALWGQFGVAVVVVLATDCIFLIATRHGLYQAQEKEFVTWMFLAGMIIFVADLLAIAWTGMWLGLTSRKANRATLGTFWRVLLLPWVVFAGGMITMVLLDEVLRLPFATTVNRSRNAEYWVLGFWFMLCLASSAWFGLGARHRLMGQFRDVAMTRYAPVGSKSGWWPFRKKNAS